MINLTIDGREVSVEKGTTVYQAARKLGIEVPIFCYQDRMPPFGACRVCLVEVEKMGKLQASCTLEARDGMVVKTQTEHAIEGRKSIVEFLLLNHPLDCPICDRGGECPLQEHALNHGPGVSRFFEEKRRFPKPLPLGPVLMLDRERCIVCARCTRFSDELAGDHALEFIDRGFRTEVGTPKDQPCESKFIGNTIKICPVGALTSQVYRFRARPWDNDPTPSTCTLCPVGCSMIWDARDGEIMRTRSNENPKVNDLWMCDKGWFGYEFSNSLDRLKQPLIHGEPASWDAALNLIVEKLKTTQDAAGWGGSPLTTEENDLFQQLYPNVDYLYPDEMGMELEIWECEKIQRGYLLGCDLTEEFPVIWLRLRQAINKGAKITYIGHYTPEIAPYMHEVILHPPGEELEMIEKHVKEGDAIFAGRPYLQKGLIAELQKRNIPLNLMQGQGNSMGAKLAGMRRGIKKDQWEFLHIAGANPKNLAKPGFLVVQDLFMTETAKKADVVLPTLCYAEKGGTFHNIEGRAQGLLPGKELPPGLYSDGEIFIELGKRMGKTLTMRTFGDCLKQKIQVQAEPIPQITGDLRLSFAPRLFDEGVRMQHNPHLYQLVKKPKALLNPQEGEKRGFHSGDKIRINRTFEIELLLDSGVALKTLVVPVDTPLDKIEEIERC